MSYAFDEIRLDERPGGTVVTLVFKDKLTIADFDHFVPQVEKIMESREKIRMLIELKDFRGWTAGALWEDTKFGFRHFDDVERLAIVGEKEWQRNMTAFISPLTRAEVCYFEADELHKAEDWIGQI